MALTLYKLRHNKTGPGDKMEVLIILMTALVVFTGFIAVILFKMYRRSHGKTKHDKNRAVKP